MGLNENMGISEMGVLVCLWGPSKMGILWGASEMGVLVYPGS